jgi:hypothetical protein
MTLWKLGERGRGYHDVGGRWLGNGGREGGGRSRGEGGGR